MHTRARASSSACICNVRLPPQTHTWPQVWVYDCARAHVLAAVRLLFPEDPHAAHTAAKPWGITATVPGAGKDGAEGAAAELPSGSSVAGGVFHICHDPDGELPTYRCVRDVCYVGWRAHLELPQAWLGSAGQGRVR